MTSVLACPVCGAALTLNAGDAACPAGHRFDRARGGYVNLLLSNQKQSADPGDSAPMLRSRRAFLRGGFYDRMAAAVYTAVGEVVGARVEPHIADLGCGEGYFTAGLHRALNAAGCTHACYGIDISRAGVRMAAASDRGITWAVASLHRSPFQPRSLDAVLTMFAPIDAPDVRRIVRDEGALITVTPGPDHLDGLRSVIYTTVKPHPDTPALMAGDTRFTQSATTRVRYPIVVDAAEQIMNLLAMTPYYWNISEETKGRIAALSRLEATVDAYVTIFRPVT
jgi:23S rRNA (guanine745-N1)-methyltransferase